MNPPRAKVPTKNVEGGGAESPQSSLMFCQPVIAGVDTSSLCFVKAANLRHSGYLRNNRLPLSGDESRWPTGGGGEDAATLEANAHEICPTAAFSHPPGAGLRTCAAVRRRRRRAQKKGGGGGGGSPRWGSTVFICVFPGASARSFFQR